MKKLILACLFVVQTVQAAWVDIGLSSGTTNFFVDFDTLQRTNNIIRVWTKHEYKSPRLTAVPNQTYLSESFYTEFDCKERKFRALSSNTYAESQLRGEIIASNSTPNPWNFAPPDTIANSMLTIVCRK